jgi:hypothetical protein
VHLHCRIPAIVLCGGMITQAHYLQSLAESCFPSK